MARRSIARYGPKGGVYHEHVNVSGGGGGGCVPIIISCFGLLVLGMVIYGGIQYSHRNDPDVLARQTVVTMHQMGIRDHTRFSLRPIGGNYIKITYHIRTTNTSRHDYSIEYCHPAYSLAFDTSPCFRIKVGAHSTTVYTKSRTVWFYGWTGQGYKDVDPNVRMRGGVNTIDDHPVSGP
jgi:hypothetical protein